MDWFRALTTKLWFCSKKVFDSEDLRKKKFFELSGVILPVLGNFVEASPVVAIGFEDFINLVVRHFLRLRSEQTFHGKHINVTFIHKLFRRLETSSSSHRAGSSLGLVLCVDRLMWTEVFERDHWRVPSRGPVRRNLDNFSIQPVFLGDEVGEDRE